MVSSTGVGDRAAAPTVVAGAEALQAAVVIDSFQGAPHTPARHCHPVHRDGAPWARCNPRRPFLLLADMRRYEPQAT